MSDSYNNNYTENTSRSNTQPEKIDIIRPAEDFLFGLKKLWWLVAVLTVLFAVVSYFSISGSYESSYTAFATVSADDSGVAEQMADLYPYLQNSGAVNEAVMEDLGWDSVNGSISMTAEDDINLLTVNVTSNDPQAAYEILQSVLRTYPSLAEFVTGPVQLVVLDDSGIPSDVNRAEVIRGSYKKGALQGFVLGLVIVCIYAYMNVTVRTRREVRRKVNVTDLGSLPAVPQKKRRSEKNANTVSLYNERIPQSYMEAIRKLRIKVLTSMEKHGYKTLLVTSSIPGEGKTTVASNLAISLAQHGKKVVLVDCDVRNPSVAKAMNEKETHPGLSDYLSKDRNLELDYIVTEVKLPGGYGKGSLSVIYGGERKADGADMLAGDKMKELIKGLKQQYDLVILDTAPVDLLTDAALVAEHADAALYVVRYHHTKMRNIRSGILALAQTGIHLTGFVFNEDHASSSKGYGYAYGYGYGSKSKYGYGNYGSYGTYAGRKAEDK